MKQFSVIIPVTDSKKLGTILEHLKNQTVDLSNGEIIIVGSDKYGFAQKSDFVQFIQTDEGHSFASDKRNIGMNIAKGEIFLFHDDDCIPHHDWIERHIEQHRLGEKVIGGAVEFPSGNYIQLADNVSAFYYMTPYSKKGYRQYVCTSNLSIHRSVYETVGEMLPHKNRADDLEWTARMRAHGYKLLFDPKIIVLHDPERNSPSSLWRHWYFDAPDTLRIRLQYADILHTPSLAQKRFLYLWGAIIIAAWATINTFSAPKIFKEYWFTLPLVYFTKLIWCWSAYRNFPENAVQDRKGLTD